MKNPVVTIVLVLLVGGTAFFGGMKYQQNQKPSFPDQFAQGQMPSGNNLQEITSGQRPNGLGNGQQGGLRGAGGMVMGEIVAQDDKSITVKLQDGSSKIVLLSDKTTIAKATTGTKSDLKTGKSVGVFGTSNSDGTVTAQNIQLNPVNRGAAGGGPPGP